MEPQERKGYWQLVLISLAGIFLEVLGVALLFVLVMLILKPNATLESIQQLIGSDLNFVYAVVGFTIVFILKNLSLVGLNLIQLRKLYGVTSSLSNRTYGNGLYADLQSQKQVQSGERINEITSITNSLPNQIIQPSITAITEVVFMVVAFIALILYKPELMALLLVVLLPPAIILIALGKRRLDRYGRVMTDSMPSLYESISNTVFGFTEIKLFGREKQYQERFENIRRKIYDKRVKSQIISTIAPQRLMEILAVSGIALMAVYFNTTGSSHNVQAVVALFASVAFRMLPSLNRIVSSVNTINTFANILDFVPATSQIDLNDKSKLEINNFKSLNINGLNFSFDQNYSLFTDLSFELKSGDFVGVFGESGAGKSTLVNFILGFYKPVSGTIEVNGIPINQCLRSWQKKLAYVPQEAFLLSDSIRANIVFGDEEASEERLQRVIRDAQLEDWISGLPEKLNTLIGERGTRISGGQRQRLAIARALYRGSEVFVFDEATNALDDTTKSEVMKTIAELNQKGKTILMISHDQTALKYAGSIFELRDGRMEIA